jgi:hypothetical protein
MYYIMRFPRSRYSAGEIGIADIVETGEDGMIKPCALLEIVSLAMRENRAYYNL